MIFWRGHGHRCSLLQRINDRTATVAVVGAGYVGLPLAVEIASAGFATVAFDKIRGQGRVPSTPASRTSTTSPTAVLAPLVKAGKLSRLDRSRRARRRRDAVVICVPTPLNKTKDPDNSFILDAADLMVPRMRAQQLIVLESTTFPGFTREVLLPAAVDHAA